MKSIILPSYASFLIIIITSIIRRTIVKTLADGSKVNCFNKRNRASYIFEKMPVGTSKVSASSGFKFDVVLLEERGEPKWT